MFNLKLTVLLTCVKLGASILCNNGGTVDWWCANEHSDDAPPQSAVSADSCFCVNYALQTQKEAYDACVGFGGFLTDVQNPDENDMIGKLVQKSSPTSTGATTFCPPNTIMFNNKCYYYSGPTVKKNWNDAEAYCKKTYNGHLTSILSKDEHAFINNLTKNCSGCDKFGHWVGGNNRGVPTNWTWPDGLPCSGLRVTNTKVCNKAWGLQPDFPKLQQCMVLITCDGGWADWTCKELQPFVCAFAPNSVLPAWIGLQKTLSGTFWNIGSNCRMNLAVSPTVDTTTEASDKFAYAYGSTGQWANAYSNVTYSTSVCRKDQKICERTNPCPDTTECSASGPNCYTCIYKG